MKPETTGAVISALLNIQEQFCKQEHFYMQLAEIAKGMPAAIRAVSANEMNKDNVFEHLKFLPVYIVVQIQQMLAQDELQTKTSESAKIIMPS